jgi:hypothetical protein
VVCCTCQGPRVDYCWVPLRESLPTLAHKATDHVDDSPCSVLTQGSDHRTHTHSLSNEMTWVSSAAHALTQAGSQFITKRPYNTQAAAITDGVIATNSYSCNVSSAKYCARAIQTTARNTHNQGHRNRLQPRTWTSSASRSVNPAAFT